jgi:hypothetical protein
MVEARGPGLYTCEQVAAAAARNVSTEERTSDAHICPGKQQPLLLDWTVHGHGNRGGPGDAPWFPGGLRGRRSHQETSGRRRRCEACGRRRRSHGQARCDGDRRRPCSRHEEKACRGWESKKIMTLSSPPPPRCRSRGDRPGSRPDRVVLPIEGSWALAG